MICGGTVVLAKDQSYVLKSPNYPLFSNTNRHCKWYFICDFDQKMTITITHLEPSYSYFVPMHYLRFNAGQSDDAPLLNEFTKSIPPTFSTPGNGLTITSERMIFRLVIDTLTTACGAQLKVTHEGIEMNFFDTAENLFFGTIFRFFLFFLFFWKIYLPVHFFFLIVGEFSSPNFGNPNSANRDKQICDWSLVTGYSNRIKIEFLNFKLQQSDYCNLDYLEIREDNKNGRLIGRFCGSELPTIDNNYLHALPQNTRNNSTNATNVAYEMGFSQLWIRYKIENSNSDTGFRIKYSLVKDIYLTEDSGKISSSQYPLANIAEEEGMFWHITTSELTVIKLTVKKIQLTMLRDSICLSSIIIYDGFDVDSPILKKICGFEPPTEPIISSSNQMTIAYSSHGMGLFLVEYKSIDQMIYEANKTIVTLFSSDKNCSEEIFLNNETTSFTITSPGWPFGYESNLNCTWTVRSEMGKKMNIKIEEIDIEGVNCYYDALKIYDRNLDDEIYLNKTFCGRMKNIDLITNSNFAKLDFSSDSIGNGTGFKSIFTTQCGGFLTGKQKGVLSFNAGRNDNYKCAWVISVRPRRKMKLKFSSLIFGNQPNNNNDCAESFVILRNGPSIDSPIIHKYCNRSNEILEINETSSNQVYVSFFALRGLYQTFKLHYEEIRVGCTQKYKLENKEDVILIESPNYPDAPQNVLECDWTFISPPSTSIRIDFKTLNPNLPCNLSEQAIAIYNGGSVYSSLLAKDCPRHLSSIVSTENMMHIFYVTTDGENLHAAFQATVQIAICGGSFLIRNRVLLKSKGFPSKYLNK